MVKYKPYTLYSNIKSRILSAFCSKTLWYIQNINSLTNYILKGTVILLTLKKLLKRNLISTIVLAQVLFLLPSLGFQIPSFALISEIPHVVENFTEYQSEQNNGRAFLLDDVENISVKEEIQIGTVNVPLYSTFNSQEKAIEGISNNSVVNLIKNTYSLDNFSNETWEKYYLAMYELLDSPSRPEWYNESDPEFRKLRQFFDIYENQEKNDKIISIANFDVSAFDVTQNTELLELLPYNSYLLASQQSEVFSKQNVNEMSSMLSFSMANGISYANSFAKSPNKAKYDYFSSGDCTNFASQILENSGVSQEVYESENSGWWHKTSTLLFITTHKHSISWIRADTFAKYMGVGYSTKNHSLFTENINVGDFIGADFGSDGDWNHIGFVTSKKNKNNGSYYDYKVAQHTSNYHEWTSTAENGWDTIEGDGGTYGRVRR